MLYSNLSFRFVLVNSSFERPDVGIPVVVRLIVVCSHNCYFVNYGYSIIERAINPSLPWCWDSNGRSTIKKGPEDAVLTARAPIHTTMTYDRPQNIFRKNEVGTVVGDKLNLGLQIRDEKEIEYQYLGIQISSSKWVLKTAYVLTWTVVSSLELVFKPAPTFMWVDEGFQIYSKKDTWFVFSCRRLFQVIVRYGTLRQDFIRTQVDGLINFWKLAYSISRTQVSKLKQCLKPVPTKSWTPVC